MQELPNKMATETRAGGRGVVGPRPGLMGVLVAMVAVLWSARAVCEAVVLDSRKTTTPVHFELIPGLVPTVYMKSNCDWTWIRGWYDAKVVSQDMTYYVPGTYCILQILVTPMRGINITFTDFDLEPKNETTGLCEDYVTIIDVRLRAATTPRMCGNETPPHFVVPHNHVALLFKTDNDSVVHKGFKLHYRRIPLPSMDPSQYMGVKNIYDTFYYSEVVTRPPPSGAPSLAPPGVSLVLFLIGLAVLLTGSGVRSSVIT